jgi:hypothetical protein
MSHQGIVQRRVLRFPYWDHARAYVTAAGIPGPAVDGGIRLASADLALAATFLNTSDESRQILPIPPSGGIVRAIGIAADSAIACCDIAFAGRDGELERHRISPGNPAFVGCSDVIDFIGVSIPWSIPRMVFGSFTEADPTMTAAHDFVDAFNEPGDPVAGFPLRLELWRGDLLPMRTFRRAPYCAHFLAAMGGITSQVRDFLICVDGRRRIDVHVRSEMAATVTAFDHVGWKPVSDLTDEGADALYATPLALIDTGSTSEVVTAANPRCFSFDGNPLTVLRVNVATASEVTAGAVEVKIRAED